MARIELNQGVCRERDFPKCTVVLLAIDVSRDCPLRQTYLAGRQRLLPDVEELAKGKRRRLRAFNVNDAIGGMRVQPVEACPGGNERTVGRILDLSRRAMPIPAGMTRGCPSTNTARWAWT